ncbi:tol-pal system-associated acyl-CoA thioesterase [Wohlfahrtiimonas larvae]|uniref:Tol-pal system-associated acyl-CoA thioesterase n=1 Tax=Wohlfahrtiimonas larvae TaxID=1157986 RepID=A0ABP9MU31_9GAMM|nr:tol-pal system-associated acyl-CoA thioesterase [Wohlfahrtiimonas larvae]
MEEKQQLVFRLPIRVYYEDTDAGGVVYHSIYLNFMERARTEWMLNRGINLNDYAAQEQKMFVVKSIQVDYKKPAHLCDDLIVETSVAKLTATRVCFQQLIYRNEELLVSGLVELVCLNTETRRPIPLPSLFS